MQFILCQTFFWGEGDGGAGVTVLSRNNATKLREKFPENCRYSIFFLTPVLSFV